MAFHFTFARVIGLFCIGSASLALGDELNRRNFIDLNRDASEIVLGVSYPGSQITQVCGLQFRTNVPNFANSHLEGFLAGVEVVESNIDDPHSVLQPVTSVAEPPYVELPSKAHPSLPHTTIRIRTRAGGTLRAWIGKSASDAAVSAPDGTPDIVVLARHC